MKKIYCLLLINIIIISANEKLPLIINTWGFTSAATEAWRVLNLSNRTTAGLDALVAGCSQCEIEQCGSTVGYGGSPDENAETTLDAMIMDGITMNMGAVANLRQIKDAIKVARHVLENTRHSFLVGDQATEFAVQMGFKKESLTTAKSKNMWKSWRKNNCQPNFWLGSLSPNPEESCGPYKPLQNTENSQSLPKHIKYPNKFNFGEGNHDTIGMVVIDKQRNIFAGTSTNGAKHKIPGRVGDSPIPGAGAYATDIGAAAATGDGDVMMRFLPSFTAVENLRNGFDIEIAAKDAIERILKYYPNFVGGIILASKDGDYSAACAGMDKFPFSVVKGNLEEKVKIEYVHCNK